MSDSPGPPPLGQVPQDPMPLVPRPRARRPARRRRPLPDAQAIAEVAVPDAAPPYDDVPAGKATRTGRTAAVRPHSGRPTPPDPGPADVEQILRAGRWPSQFAQVLAETLAGARPAEQLTPWTTQQARRRISQLGPMLAAGPQPRVRRIIAISPAAGVLEMTAIIAAGPQVRAMAVRLECPARNVPPAAAPAAGPEAATEPASAPPLTRNARLRAAASWICTAVEVA